MNILEKLPFVHDDNETESPEDVAAREKAERIQFHRESVRNGPVKFKSPTTGQQRRFRDRATKSLIRKNRRRQVRAYFAEQREAAQIRTHLQFVGVVAFANPDTPIRSEQIVASAIWLVRHFAQADAGDTVEVTETVVREAFQAALTRWGQIVGVPGLTVPEDYVLPVRLSA